MKADVSDVLSKSFVVLYVERAEERTSQLVAYRTAHQHHVLYLDAHAT